MATISYPQVWLSINGVQIPCMSGRASRKAKRACNTFSCSFSAARAAELGMGYDFWADFQKTDGTLIMSSAPGGSDARAMVTGEIDTPEIDWLEGVINVSSRDNSKKLAQKKIQKKYINQPSSAIFSDVVNQVGLTPAPQNSGADSGVQYNSDTAHLVINRSGWEALDDLADREGYRWYTEANTAYFEPDTQSNGKFAVHYTPPQAGQPASGNILRLTTRRDMNAAAPHSVTVKSWHHKQKKKYEHTETLGGTGETISHEHHHNMRTQSQIETLAKSRLRNATRHDMQVSIEMHGDLSCDVRQTLTLSGTGTIYDQDYEIDDVDFEIEHEGGFVMTIEAKSPRAGRSSSSGGSPAAPDSSTGPASDTPAGTTDSSGVTTLPNGNIST